MSRFDDLWQSASPTRSVSGSVDEGLRTYMVGVYGYMGLGLLITAFVSFFVSQSPALMKNLFATPLRWVVLFAPLGVVIFLGTRFHKLSYEGARATFAVYAGLVGLSIASIFIVYQSHSIGRIFLVSAGMFGSMSLYGYTTKKDLTSLGSFMGMAVVGIVIASLVNLFFQNSVLSTMLSVVCVLVFTGLTAYDTQSIKELYFEGDSSQMQGKKAIFGALRLYLDFLNIFLALLHLFGERRN
jgi:FtsH-binding integral membrane protein